MDCACHPGAPRPATHKGRTGRLLCAESADRAVRNAEWIAARLRPEPLPASLFSPDQAARAERAETP